MKKEDQYRAKYWPHTISIGKSLANKHPTGFLQKEKKTTLLFLKKELQIKLTVKYIDKLWKNWKLPINSSLSP